SIPVSDEVAGRLRACLQPVKRSSEGRRSPKTPPGTGRFDGWTWRLEIRENSQFFHPVFEPIAPLTKEAGGLQCFLKMATSLAPSKLWTRGREMEDVWDAR